MPENDYYGHKLALAWYCGMAQARPVFGTLPHGWSLDLQPSRRRTEFAPLFLYNGRHLRQASSLGVRNARCIGAPFTYLVKSLWPDGAYPIGHGTLVFGSHSSEGMVETWSTSAMVAAVEREC